MFTIIISKSESNGFHYQKYFNLFNNSVWNTLNIMVEMSHTIVDSLIYLIYS